MKIITVLNEKGGCSKTTIATHIASLAASIGYRVLLIDGDPQGHATISMQLPKSAGLYDWLVRGASINDVARQHPDIEAITPPGRRFNGTLYIVPGNSETIGIPQQVDSHALKDALLDIESSLDLVILDTAPATSAMVSMIYHATDAAVIPTQVETLSIDGMVSTITHFGRFEHKQIQILGIVPNFFDTTNNVTRANLAELIKVGVQRGWPVWSPIKYRAGWKYASNNRCMVYRVENQTGQAATRELYKVFGQFMKAIDDVQKG